MPFDGNFEDDDDDPDGFGMIWRALLAKMWGCPDCWRLRFDPTVVSYKIVAVFGRGLPVPCSRCKEGCFIAPENAPLRPAVMRP